eukprot:4365573-Prymnesium_polylepis.2
MTASSDEPAPAAANAADRGLPLPPLVRLVSSPTKKRSTTVPARNRSLRTRLPALPERGGARPKHSAARRGVPRSCARTTRCSLSSCPEEPRPPDCSRRRIVVETPSLTLASASSKHSCFRVEYSAAASP